MAKITNPKAWYLLGAGAVALAADGARRLLRRRRPGGSAGYRSAEILLEEEAKTATTKPVVTATPTAEAQAKTEEAVEEKGRQAAAAKSQATETATRTAGAVLAADDLTEIKGIGPVFAERLRQAGITTFADVAKTPAEQLREVTHATSVANPDEWIAQAKAKR
jgi:predicted flap endonuclease-1-like 5' DNA nuclease